MEEKSDFEVHSRSREMDIIRKEWIPFEPGTRWKCLRCSECCRKPWAVNLTWVEYDRLKADPRASALKIDKLEIDPETGVTHPYFIIDGKCPMLSDPGAVCTLYPDWPYTCATYPFLLLPDGSLMVHSECLGIGHGDVVDPEAMRDKILRERRKAGMIVP